MRGTTNMIFSMAAIVLVFSLRPGTGAVLGVVIPDKTQETGMSSAAITQTVVASSIEVNLSRFVTQMLAEARLVEQEVEAMEETKSVMELAEALPSARVETEKFWVGNPSA
ncbi:hypothetical protein GGI25_004802 [Coemansia spiralis]|uniref:Uncharacterized protein n=2 Tax=Coemansia TaxID=4863 RepID=A0A9W8G4X4_9FUNG|nr:hypothetical protein BX070DRAFT_218524 [Coemansia spiralis]KAJ1989260.1 hypothetical protein EDC05_004781 [Coemansia umbellata]KAJ2620256.1 hypothetical protein GGI26_005145 [Coemansia sp. RSA 1358]KAJ2673208.1 hypothetical protein GGI25_004802 [Coemansia spiralis]